MITPTDILQQLLSIEGMETPRPTPFFTDEPKLPIYVANIGEHSWGQGIHPHDVVAQLKAAAEALERHCLLLPADDNSVQARYGELENQIDPADFFCYSSAQVADYQREIADIRNAVYHWTPVQDAISGAAAFVPREFVYLDAADHEPKRIRWEANSSGAAIGLAGTGDAFRRSLFELIERDAFLSSWLSNSAPARIGNFTSDAAALIALLQRYRLDCRAFDLSGDLGVPIVFVLTLDESGQGPAVTSGLAAAPTYSEAAVSAILESISYRRQARIKTMSGQLPDVTDPAGIVSVESRIAYWSRPERLAELPAWTAAHPSLSLPDLDGIHCSAPQALDKLAAQGCRVFQASITLPAAATAGFEAVRVIVPQLLPLYLSETAKTLSCSRFGSIDFADNPLPHPFA